MPWPGLYPDWWTRKMLWPQKWRSILICSPTSSNCRPEKMCAVCCCTAAPCAATAVPARAAETQAQPPELRGLSELCVQLRHCSPCSQIQLLSLCCSSPAQERSWTPPCPGTVHPRLSMENCNTLELYFPPEIRLRAPSAPWLVSSGSQASWEFLLCSGSLQNLLPGKCVRFLKCIKDSKY